MRESSTLLFDESNRALPGSVWTDIATGASAAHHGYIHEEQVALNSYRSQHMDASTVSVAPFYKHLSDAGIRCAVVDYPVDYPLEDFNGVQVIDWGTEFKLWHFETRPVSVATQLVSDYGQHPLTNYGNTRIGLHNLIKLRDKLIHGIDIKRRYAIDLLRRNEYEFIFFNFAELHKAGHFFWGFHDRGHPQFTDSEPGLVTALRDSYEAADRAVGAVLAELGAGDDLIVVTDRGMQADHRGDHLIEEILLKLGLAAPRGRTRASPQAPRLRLPGGQKARSLYRSVGEMIPGHWRDALLPFHRAALGDSPPLDWSATRVFRLPSVGNSYLRINVTGRDAVGLVAPGAQYDAMLETIAAQFRALVNVETGEPAVDGVYFPAREFPGPRSAELPDVAILWNSNAAINAVTSADLGTVSGKDKSRRTGNHRTEGFALCRGPYFGADTDTYVSDPRALAPTILRRFGVPAPAHFERQPI
jgi:predicted AlkP superfamily phosphohydrolase/phosphomutase